MCVTALEKPNTNLPANSFALMHAWCIRSLFVLDDVASFVEVSFNTGVLIVGVASFIFPLEERLLVGGAGLLCSGLSVVAQL